MYLLGIDCATVANRTGLALGELLDGRVKILEVATGGRRSPAEIAVDWMSCHDIAIIALDAPLGWPRAMHTVLPYHEAGMPISDHADLFFSRATDREIRARLRKHPLEVGADRIARTALAALKLLQELRERTGYPIPLALKVNEDVPLRAIEVYPAATRRGHGAPDKAGSLKGMESLIDPAGVAPLLGQSEHARDAVVCVLAAADFVRGEAVPPVDREIARIEGWIWAKGGRRE